MAEIEVRSPANGALVRTVTETTVTELEQWAARARAAQPEWAAAGIRGRAKVLLAAQRWMAAHDREVLARVIAETGQTYEDALNSDFGYAVAALGFWARNGSRYLADERLPAVGNPVLTGKRIFRRYVPVGVVGVIGPARFPLLCTFGDCIPALMAGNAVIAKPSERAPGPVLLMAEILKAAGLPDGVFSVALGGGELGGALVDQVDYVMFTGSTDVGRKVAVQAAARLIGCQLELSGKDPMIVCGDADLERCARAAAYWSFHSAGQACTSVQRCYVEAPIYDAFVARVVEITETLRQGAPNGPACADIGAMVSAADVEVVERQVAAAVAQGARVLVGGHGSSGPGNFFEPTVLVDVDHSMAVMVEDTPGPVLPIMKVDDLEQAVNLANDSEYGLQASVFTDDLERGEQLARALEAGAVCINDAQVNYLALNLPMGGWKSSGLGTRHGADGIRKFCRSQSLLSSNKLLRRDLFMFPYSLRRTQLLRAAYRRRFREPRRVWRRLRPGRLWRLLRAARLGRRLR